MQPLVSSKVLEVGWSALCEVVVRFFTRDELPEMLSSVDYILAMLPATPETDNLLGGDLLASCKGVGLVSLGRGNICNEEQVTSFKVLVDELRLADSEGLGQRVAAWCCPRCIP